ncbi:hypothetical protein BX616_005803 [Lobosporangium transversale]|uniref:Uncharacterized protein n=1 Tax=Lobosporangium transversale TaxID=64571 RepID=A0A1Y2G7M2_9FUNG|nr:hypothetical protein BCR41DRAFT_390704 [Lobosporangium transversale]KAF9897321.1 hypothetical protein BX616_005803 [Lobosporangium transversale]ORY96095.1 hypothetical protein BCR41DRAFT_390704 [Lobosporangium transversale]|eukprot:XP_021875514.1 hypothetical protein BCR41DRAFT_390704 [Lobosporangium transversale]
MYIMKRSEISQSSTLSQNEQPKEVSAAADSSSKVPTAITKTPKGRFTKQDIESILTWLEYPPNFKSVFGYGGQTIIGKPHQSSYRGWATLAQVVSKQNKGRDSLNTKSVQERFRRHLKLFTETKKLENQTGFGVTDEDRKKGIYTTKHKLEKMCICYARTDALFDPRANVAPLFTFGSGCENGSENSQEDIEKVPCRRLIGEEEEVMDLNKPIGNQEAIENDQFLGDSTLADNAFDNSFYDDFSAGTESDMGAKGEGTDLNDESSKDISDLSIPSISSISSSVLHSNRKRKLTVAGSLQSSVARKRSRVIEERRKPPTLNLGSFPETPRKSFYSSFELISAKENIEMMRLELDKKRMILEKQKIEEQMKREDRKLELEKQKMEKEDAREKQKIEIEKQKMEQNFKVQTMLLMKSAIEQGMTIEQIQSLIKLLP